MPIRLAGTKSRGTRNLNRPQEALQWLDAAIKQKPTEPSFYRIKGGILENQKRYNEAAANYRASLKLYTIDWAVFRLVRCLEYLQKYDEAINELSKLIATNQDGLKPSAPERCSKLKSKILPEQLKTTTAVSPLSQLQKPSKSALSYIYRPDTKISTNAILPRHKIGRKPFLRADETVNRLEPVPAITTTQITLHPWD